MAITAFAYQAGLASGLLTQVKDSDSKWQKLERTPRSCSGSPSSYNRSIDKKETYSIQYIPIVDYKLLMLVWVRWMVEIDPQLPQTGIDPDRQLAIQRSG